MVKMGGNKWFSPIFMEKNSVTAVREIVTLLNKGEIQAAIAASRSLVNSNQDSAEAWLVYSEVLYTARTFGQASQAAGRAFSLSNTTNIKLNLTRCLASSGEIEEALTYARQLALEQNLNATNYSILSKVFTNAGQHQEALQTAKMAEKFEPNNSTFLYNLAMANRACGKIGNAINYLNKVISFNPKDWQAYKNRSDLKTWTDIDNNLIELKAILPSEEESPAGYVLISAAISKELEDIGSYDKAFMYLKEGAEARRNQIRYNVANDVSIMRSLSHYQDEAFLKDALAIDKDIPTPIFILGLPRSGSTLLEQIVGASPFVQAMGELPDLPQAIMGQVREKYAEHAIEKKRLPELSTKLDFEKIGLDYMGKISARGVKGGYFTDKLPMNFLNIGLIKKVLPQAKIIHIMREPLDACYAIYKNFFGNSHPYSYDFEELAAYYHAYSDLMKHWSNAMPKQALLEVSYENLVTEPEMICEQLFEKIGLHWDTKYLLIENSGIATNSASAAQVSKPIYLSSVGAWRRVKNQIEPLANLLDT